MGERYNKRIIAEITELQQGGHNGSLFVAWHESDLRDCRVLMLGPHGTPYELGFFECKLVYGKDWPASPPKVTIETTKGGKTRFGPNLYANGKICLSILGTWQGENWSPILRLEAVLVSIQSLMSHVPYRNEPGFDNTSETEPRSLAYTAKIAHETMKITIIEKLEKVLGINSAPQSQRGSLAGGALKNLKRKVTKAINPAVAAIPTPPPMPTMAFGSHFFGTAMSVPVRGVAALSLNTTTHPEYEDTFNADAITSDTIHAFENELAYHILRVANRPFSATSKTGHSPRVPGFDFQEFCAQLFADHRVHSSNGPLLITTKAQTSMRTQIDTIIKTRFLWYYEAYVAQVKTAILNSGTRDQLPGTPFGIAPFEDPRNGMLGSFDWPDLLRRLPVIKYILNHEPVLWHQSYKACPPQSFDDVILQFARIQNQERSRRPPRLNLELLDPCNDLTWIITYHGKPGTSLAGGRWRIKFSISPCWPHEQPRVRFLTHIQHLMVTKDGYLCYTAQQKDDLESHIDGIVAALEQEEYQSDLRICVNSELWVLYFEKEGKGRKEYESRVQISALNSLEEEASNKRQTRARRRDTDAIVVN